MGEKLGEHGLRHRPLIAGDAEAPLGHVECPDRRSPIGLGVVQHAIAQAIALEHAAGERIIPRRERQFAGHPMPIQDQRPIRQSQRLGEFEVGEMLGEKRLDAAIRRATVLPEQPGLFAERIEHPLGDRHKPVIIPISPRNARRRKPARQQMQIHPPPTHRLGRLIPIDRNPQKTLQIHAQNAF